MFKYLTAIFLLFGTSQVLNAIEYAPTNTWQYNSSVATISSSSTDNISIPGDFVAGTNISSSEMNNRFNKIEELLNKLIKIRVIARQIPFLLQLNTQLYH